MGYVNLPITTLTGDVFANETDTGYLPVTLRTTLDTMWGERSPDEVISSERNCLQM